MWWFKERGKRILFICILITELFCRDLHRMLREVLLFFQIHGASSSSTLLYKQRVRVCSRFELVDFRYAQSSTYGLFLKSILQSKHRHASSPLGKMRSKSHRVFYDLSTRKERPHCIHLYSRLQFLDTHWNSV